MVEDSHAMVLSVGDSVVAVGTQHEHTKDLKVADDVGLESDNAAKIDAFIEAVNSNDNSRAIHVASGGPSPADAIMNSYIYMERDASAPVGEGGTGVGEGGADASEFPFGVDPAQDPELAMALQISMQGERARQEAARQTETGAGGDAGREAPNEAETRDCGGAGESSSEYESTNVASNKISAHVYTSLQHFQSVSQLLK